MPTLVEKIACSLCCKEFDNQAEAKKCERWGLCLPYYKIGDIVVFSENFGERYGEIPTGVIKDILFPTWWKSRSGKVVMGYRKLLSHEYQVSYLVEIAAEEAFPGEYFELEKIVGNFVVIVPESSMFFGNKHDMSQRLIIHSGGPQYDTRRGERKVVTSWDDYVIGVVAANPGLADRMQRLSLFFKAKGIIQ